MSSSSLPLDDGTTPTRFGRQGRSLTDGVVDALGTRLRNGEIKPGDKLPSESEIVQSFGVSRGVVREALSRLQAAGLVQTQHGIGTFALETHVDGRFRLDNATVVDLDDMLAVLELRTSVESDAAGLAALRRTDAQLASMHQALDDFTRQVADGGGGTIAPDFRFHQAIAQATGNRYYDDVVGQLALAVIPRTRFASARLDPDARVLHLQKVNQEHRDIHAAIERRDPEAARAAMRIHLVNSRERQRRAHDAPP